MEGPQKVKNRSFLRSSNYTTRYLPKGYKNTEMKGYMHPDVYSSIIKNSQILEKAQMSTNWWMDEEDVACIYIHIYIYIYIYINIHTHFSTIKKNEILPFAMTRMKLECIMLNEIYQSKKRQISYVTHTWNLRNKIDEHRGKKTETTHKTDSDVSWLQIHGFRIIYENLP